MIANLIGETLGIAIGVSLISILIGWIIKIVSDFSYLTSWSIAAMVLTILFYVGENAIDDSTGIQGHNPLGYLLAFIIFLLIYIVASKQRKTNAN